MLELDQLTLIMLSMSLGLGGLSYLITRSVMLLAADIRVRVRRPTPPNPTE